MKSGHLPKWFAPLAALVFVAGCSTDGTPAAAPPDLPDQALLASSMHQQPTPGWTLAATDLGLPQGAVVKPIGNIGDLGVFVGIARQGRWLFAVDVTTGQRTFGPISFGAAGDATSFNCFVNGPPDVLCVRQGPDLDVPATVWVVDTDAGSVVHEGPSSVKLSRAQGHPILEQIGDRVVATVEREGVHGVGPRGELTWFVPGDGILPAQFAFWDHDTRRSALAVQGGGQGGDVVFSTVDGTIINPSLPQDVLERRAVVYPDGFGYEYSASPSQDFVGFFDDSGRQRGASVEAEDLENRSLDIPMVKTESTYRALTLDGRQLLEIPRTDSSPNARLIGSRLFIADDRLNREWQEFDLRTGAKGKTCASRNLGFDYIGSDGEVAVTRGEGILAQAVDLTTCEILWSTPGSGTHEFTEIWKVGTALIQRTNDTIFSLVAPG